MQTRRGQVLFSGAQRQDKKQHTQTETQRFHLDVVKQLLLYVRVLAQVAQEYSGVFILGDVHKLSECGPGQLSLGGPA